MEHVYLMLTFAVSETTQIYELRLNPRPIRKAWFWIQQSVMYYVYMYLASIFVSSRPRFTADLNDLIY